MLDTWVGGAAEAGRQGGVDSGGLGCQVKFGFSLVGNREPWKVLEEGNNISNIMRSWCSLDYVSRPLSPLTP